MASILLRVVAAIAAVLAVAASFSAGTATAQTDGLLQLDDKAHLYLDNQRTLGNLPAAHLGHKPLSTYAVRSHLDDLPPAPFDSVANPLGPLYGNGRDLWLVRGDDYALQVNPLLYLSVGRAPRWIDDGRPTGFTDTRTTWRNTRGIRASGHIGEHIFFEARVEETQERPALTRYEPRSADRLPTVRRYADLTGYDYQIAMGVVGFVSEHFEIRFGRDRNHWGYGEGSLVLSDYAPAYEQLQIRTSFWRLQYVNLFTRFRDLNPFGLYVPNTLIEPKYGAFHRLSVNVSDRINLNVFEGVVFGSDTTSGRGGGYDLAYLNPVIFYRPVESDIGSPDNVLIGFGGSWIILDGVRIYGQMLLDEFVVGKLFSTSWLNKTGYLGGIHVVPTSTLSLRTEIARLRPYLYTHRSSTTAYMHHLDILGHPAGPNAVDYSFFLDWIPRSPWRIHANVAYTLSGRGTEDRNVGSDLRLNYEDRVADRAPLLDGFRHNRLLAEVSVGYEFLPELYLEVAARGERIDDEVEGVTAYIEPLVSLRWGLPFESVRY